MRTTVALFALIAAAVAADISCEERISFGKLDVHKNSIEKGDYIPLTFDDAGKLAASKDGLQYLASIIPCTSTHVGRAAKVISTDKKTISVTGRLTGNGGKCIARNPSDQSLALVDCATNDGPEQDAQFWTVDLVNNAEGLASGTNAVVKFVNEGHFHHFFEVHLYESIHRPPSNWIMTFSHLS